ncbi:hypothetical protein Vadar_021886 [Vaccinium darrowii]|uniref:Uncharacterized protein n=1 Tax=Vaccinium darrowii TaxID=229202 RepID=A0ACB7ZEA0_9ERIC|nr:hypothetical protein Vadar_021886 [Vaccinium darrowii]
MRIPDQRSSAKRGVPLEKYQQFTPLVAMAEQILDDLHDDPDLKWPGKLHSDPNKRPKDKWCRFHRDHGHTTDDCIDLKQQIEGLIQRGRLRRFVKNQKPPRKDERPKNNQNKDQIQNTPIREIVAIHGGPGAGGDSNKSKKAHLRKLGQMKADEVNLVERPNKLTKLGRPPIVFSEEDEEGISYPHDDPLVISMVVANYRIKRVLVSTGASTDIMYYSSFLQLGIDEKQLRQVKSNLYGFSRKPIPLKGRIALPNSRDNPIKIYSGETVDMRDEEKLIHGEPVEELVEAELEPGRPEPTIKLGVALDPRTRTKLLEFLRENKDVFAWYTTTSRPSIQGSYLIGWR